MSLENTKVSKINPDDVLDLIEFAMEFAPPILQAFGLVEGTPSVAIPTPSAPTSAFKLGN